MQTWITAPTFEAKKPNPEVFEPAGSWNAVVPPVSPWTVSPTQQAPVVQEYQTDENLKKQFGIELAKSTNPFEAGCKVFGEETSKALWASFNWLNDPIVVASRDVYLKIVEVSQPLLDKEQLAAKVLKLAEGEKVELNGVMRSTVEAKDRIAAYKLYSDIAGYTGKVEIDASTKSFTHNEMVIKLVKAEDKKVTVIDQAPKNEIKNEISNSPITLKLVGGVRA